MPQREFDDLKRLLRDLDDRAALQSNALITHFSLTTHDARRAIVLRAIETLDPGSGETSANERRRRHLQSSCVAT